MRVGLIIADFESCYSTSFHHTARVKYNVDFDTSIVESIKTKINELKVKFEKNQHNNRHVGFELTLEHILHVELRLNQLIEKYIEVFQILPPHIKIYEVTRQLRETDSPTPKEFAKEVLVEIINPVTPEKLTKSEKLRLDVEEASKKRALTTLKKNGNKRK